MGKIGPKFSQIVSIRLEGGTPPKAVSLTAFSQFFLTASLRSIKNTQENVDKNEKTKEILDY